MPAPLNVGHFCYGHAYIFTTLGGQGFYRSITIPPSTILLPTNRISPLFLNPCYSVFQAPRSVGWLGMCFLPTIALVCRYCGDILLNIPSLYHVQLLLVDVLSYRAYNLDLAGVPNRISHVR